MPASAKLVYSDANPARTQPKMPDPAETTALPDQHLVRQALSNPDEFAHLIRRYEPRIRRYVWRLGQTGTGQDDLLQDIFLQTWIHLNGYDPTRPFAPWLYRIAYTQCALEWRKSNRRRADVSGADADRIFAALAAAGSVEQVQDQAKLQRKIEIALDRLAEKSRAVLVLRYLEDCSYLEIAEVLHLPSGTIASLIHRGLRDLRTHLTQSGVTSIDHWTLP